MQEDEAAATAQIVWGMQTAFFGSQVIGHQFLLQFPDSELLGLTKGPIRARARHRALLFPVLWVSKGEGNRDTYRKPSPAVADKDLILSKVGWQRKQALRQAKRKELSLSLSKLGTSFFLFQGKGSGIGGLCGAQVQQGLGFALVLVL